jgi:hypothetical protein
MEQENYVWNTRKWDFIWKILRRAHDKYSSANEQMHLPVLGTASTSMFKTVANTPDTNLTDARRTFKVICKAHFESYYASVSLRIGSIIADNTDSTKGLEAGPNTKILRTSSQYTMNNPISGMIFVL